jgi:uncharacterized membrane protein (Fun14 family)
MSATTASEGASPFATGTGFPAAITGTSMCRKKGLASSYVAQKLNAVIMKLIRVYVLTVVAVTAIGVVVYVLYLVVGGQTPPP